MNSTTIFSPDRSKGVVLQYDGEARFGPAFFRAVSLGFEWPLASTTIGEDVHWSADSRYAVVLVFHSRDTSRPPNVELVAVDTETGDTISVDRTPLGMFRQAGFNSSGEYEYASLEHGLAVQKKWIPAGRSS